MRRELAKEILANWNLPDVFFLTGDLGFMALEEVKSTLGTRFVNTGVAEQNMVGIAAGLAREGHKVFAYSIAPFCYARPFEQIRNDICMANLPICLIGNGGGYAYGAMGPTHHALEDCAAMSALGMRVLVPAFNEDLGPMLSSFTAPTYLRLGYDTRPPKTAAPAYAPWRQLLTGSRGVLTALGPLGGVAWGALQDLPEKSRPSVWVASELGTQVIPADFYDQLSENHPLYVIEEHVAAGGLAMHLAYAISQNKLPCGPLRHHYALGYPSGRYGSQSFHRAECGLDAIGIRQMILAEL